MPTYRQCNYETSSSRRKSRREHARKLELAKRLEGVEIEAEHHTELEEHATEQEEAQGKETESRCSGCDGYGVVLKVRQLGKGMTQQTRCPCDDCGGKYIRV